MPDFDFAELTRILRDFRSWSPPRLTFYVISLLSLLTSLMVGRLLAGSRMVTLTSSYITLFFFGVVGNYIGRTLSLEATTDLQRAIIFTVIGQIPAIFLLFLIFKREERR